MDMGKLIGAVLAQVQDNGVERATVIDTYTLSSPTCCFFLEASSVHSVSTAREIPCSQAPLNIISSTDEAVLHSVSNDLGISARVGACPLAPTLDLYACAD